MNTKTITARLVADEKAEHQELEDLLDEYVMGRLSPSKTRLIRRHICSCVECSEQVAESQLIRMLFRPDGAAGYLSFGITNSVPWLKRDPHAPGRNWSF